MLCSEGKYLVIFNCIKNSSLTVTRTLKPNLSFLGKHISCLSILQTNMRHLYAHTYTHAHVLTHSLTHTFLHALCIHLHHIPYIHESQSITERGIERKNQNSRNSSVKVCLLEHEQDMKNNIINGHVIQVGLLSM